MFILLVFKGVSVAPVLDDYIVKQVKRKKVAAQATFSFLNKRAVKHNFYVFTAVLFNEISILLLYFLASETLKLYFLHRPSLCVLIFNHCFLPFRSAVRALPSCIPMAESDYFCSTGLYGLPWRFSRAVRICRSLRTYRSIYNAKQRQV